MPLMPIATTRASEFAQVVLGLWDSWEDDAIVIDKASGLFSIRPSCTCCITRASIFRCAGR